MHGVISNALLTTAAILGSFRFVTLFDGARQVSAGEQVTTTVGVTAFLIAVGFLLQRSGVIGALLIILLIHNIYHFSRTYILSDSTRFLCAWISIIIIFMYIQAFDS